MQRVLVIALQLLFLAAVSLSTSSHADAEFLGEPQTERFTVPNGFFGWRSEYRLLLSNFSFIDSLGQTWTSPHHEVSDGATIPWFARPLVGGPFDRENLPAALVHDYYCCSAARDFDDTHWTFYEGMLESGASKVKAGIMLGAIYVGGPTAWTTVADNPPAPCQIRTEAGNVKLERGARALTQSEAADIPTRKRMLSKIFAMARTLVTTGGEVLDYVDGQPVMMNRENAGVFLRGLNNAARFGFADGAQDMGLFTAVEEQELLGLDAVRPWAEGQFPNLETFRQVAPPAAAPESVAFNDPAIDRIPDSAVY